MLNIIHDHDRDILIFSVTTNSKDLNFTEKGVFNTLITYPYTYLENLQVMLWSGSEPFDRTKGPSGRLPHPFYQIKTIQRAPGFKTHRTPRRTYTAPTSACPDRAIRDA